VQIAKAAGPEALKDHEFETVSMQGTVKSYSTILQALKPERGSAVESLPAVAVM
jgi:hypothetical protein